MIVHKSFNFAVIYRVLNVPSIIPLGKIRLAPIEGHFCEAASGEKLFTFFFAICEAPQNFWLFFPQDEGLGFSFLPGRENGDRALSLIG